MPEAGVPLSYYFTLSTLLFSMGVYGALRRTNAITILMSIELMLNSVNLNFMAFARHLGAADPVRGPMFVIFILTVAAAEVSVGLAILLALVRRRRSVADVNEIDTMKG